jgi:hypothetical protein
MCYRVAAGIAEDDEFIKVAARAGEVALRLGLESEKGVVGDDLRAFGSEVVKECKGMGATLEAVGKVIEACLVGEIIKAK